MLALACLCFALPADGQAPTTKAAILSGSNPILFRYSAGDSVAALGGTFSRASTATYTDASGVIQTATSGTLRDSHYINGKRHVLLEGTRTNPLLRSQEFAAAAWTYTNASAGASATAPDGTSTATTIAESAMSGLAVRNTSAATITTATAYAATLYVKRGNSDWVRLFLGDSTGITNGVQAWYNVNSGAVGTSNARGAGWTLGSARIAAAANGFYRLELTATSSGTAAYVALVSAGANADTNRANVGGGVGIGVAYTVWQAQLEAGAFMSSPIPTTSATVTRAVDALSLAPGSHGEWTRYERYYNLATAAYVEAVTTGTGSLTYAPTVDRAYRDIIWARGTQTVGFFQARVMP